MTCYKGPGNVIYSGGPSCDPTPKDCHDVKVMPQTIPNKVPKMSHMGDSAFSTIDPRTTEVPEFDPATDGSPYQSMVAYGASPQRPSQVALGSAPDAEDAEDQHPIQPFHQVLRGEKFKYKKGYHEPGKRVNVYERENLGGGKAERVELHHDPATGNIMSHTFTGMPGGKTVPTGSNTSPEKLHRNIYEASYRVPQGMPAGFSSAQLKEYKERIKAPPPKGKIAAPTAFGARAPRQKDAASDELEGD